MARTFIFPFPFTFAATINIKIRKASAAWLVLACSAWSSSAGVASIGKSLHAGSLRIADLKTHCSQSSAKEYGFIFFFERRVFQETLSSTWPGHLATGNEIVSICIELWMENGSFAPTAKHLSESDGDLSQVSRGGGSRRTTCASSSAWA